MILSLIVIAFIAAMTWTWATQGMFSAFIHLVLTVIAGAVAFAFWEPLVYSFLLNRMPEQAWGLGLLIPFGLTLLALRTVFDKLVPGNVDFHNIANTAGGGVLGFISGVLTAGMLVIGLQMVGLPSVAGYQGYKFNDETGQVERNQSLIIPADSITAAFFRSLSGGALAPMLSNNTLEVYHPALAREASLYHQSAFWDQGIASSRRGLSPENLTIVQAPNGYNILSDIPPSLRPELDKSIGGQVVIIGVEVVNQTESGSVAADSGGIFRIGKGQVALAARDGRGEVTQHYPTGYIQNRQYQSLKVKGDYAYSGTGDRVVHHWVFQIPAGQTPMYLTMKQARVPLPDASQANRDVSKAEELLGVPSGIIAAQPDNQPPPAEEFQQIAVVSPSLMARMSKNRLDQFGMVLDKEGALVSGEGRYVPDPQDRSVGDALTISLISHPENARVVRVNLGERDKPRSLIGQVLNFAAQVAAPKLVTASGKEYLAIGYGVRQGGAYRFKIDPTNKITSLAQLDLGKVSATDSVYLFYQVDVGETVVEFRLGTTRVTNEPLNLPVR